MGRYPVGPGLRMRSARLIGGVTLALAGLAPAWVAAPATAAAVTHPTGGVVAWGDGSAGQTIVPADARSGVISVAAGCAHSLALRSDGRVVAWGDNTYGQTNVPVAAQSGVAGIVAGCNHSLALKSNGTIVAWGDNSYGQVNVPSLPRGFKWTNIAAGSSHSVGVARTRSAVDVYVWGDTSSGQAEVTPSDSDSTTSIDSHDIVDVEAGGNATIALMKDRTVRVWGDGIIIGTGAAQPSVRNVPAGLADAVGMSMGWAHALVVRSTGSVAAWGDNSGGQLTVPANAYGAKAVAAGGAHSLALRTDGVVVGWGANDAGQATPSSRGQGHYVWIAAGLKHSLAVGKLAPDAPQGVTATPSDGAVTVSWTPPEDPGSAPITGYTVTAAPTGESCVTTEALECTIEGLTNGTAYKFAVAAGNSIGMGPAALSSLATPGLPVPPTTEPTPTPTPSPTPSASPAPSGSSGGGSGGGLPLPLMIVVAVVIGIGAAVLAYSPSLVAGRARGLLGRLRGSLARPPAGWRAAVAGRKNVLAAGAALVVAALVCGLAVGAALTAWGPGTGGGLPLPAVLTIAAALGAGVAVLAYDPSLVAERARQIGLRRAAVAGQEKLLALGAALLTVAFVGGLAFAGTSASPSPTPSTPPAATAAPSATTAESIPAPTPAGSRATAGPTPDGSAVPSSSMVGRYRHTATVLKDGRVLIAGGQNSESIQKSAVLYDPQTGTFTPTGSMTTVRRWHSAALLADGRVLIVGGDGYHGALSSAELYDPETGRFTPTGSMTGLEGGGPATLLADGRVLVVGGDSAELYDPVAGTFAAIGSMINKSGAGSATLLADGRVLVVGGVSAELYDPWTGTFTATGSMNGWRSGHTATLLPDGRVLVAGGMSGSSHLSSAELYDPKTGTFTPTGSMKSRRTDAAAAVLPDGRVLVAGGMASSDWSKCLATAELYDPKTGTFKLTGSMAQRRTDHTAVALLDGSVLVVGGTSGSVFPGRADRYDPIKGVFSSGA